MPKELHGEPNEWANRFYRLIEDFVYGVVKLEEFKTKLLELGIDIDVHNYLITKMTIPPSINYSKDD